MSEWVSFNSPLNVDVCVILKRRRGKQSKWEYQEIQRFCGDWSDLVYELYSTFGQFVDQVDHFTKKCDMHDRLDSIAIDLSRKNRPYEFSLPDFTDDWYVAYCKPVSFRVDTEGEVR